MKLFKTLNRFAHKILGRIASRLCNIFGHRWMYKDYSNYIQADGTKYPFKASRNCPRCNLHAYYYLSEWKVEAKSNIDYEGDYFSVPKIEINKVVYT